MKYCSHCGQALGENSNVCPACGKTNEPQVFSAPKERKESGLATAAKVLMILGTVVNAISGFLIPLAWCLPMTISYCNKLKRGEPISIMTPLPFRKKCFAISGTCDMIKMESKILRKRR